ncbi:response regulator transcription factor [Kordia algicida OT-1]|uniref:Receiver component of a two-component response regulator n=1 Tax=Kordia algicida OT-1 TaxID=391587 RepID=A9DKR1_9FLAO|nr:response regulator transcription factor [Kordia algicida]EDP98382.1 Receiver component of a two-component response regulator [Kordia algicida OT-1]
MFTKVLIAEDMDDINTGVLTALSQLEIATIDQTQYCDDADLKAKKARKDKKPYELLITDLSFAEDHRKQKLASGEDLLKKLKKDQPNLKVIVYSVEDKLQRIRRLYNMHGIDAYVCKGRKSLQELKKAIKIVYKGEKYLSAKAKNALSNKSDMEIDDYDIGLLKLLSKGMSQDEISANLKGRSISPNSLSSIEKRLSKLKIYFKANNAIHLIANAKDLGLI